MVVEVVVVVIVIIKIDFYRFWNLIRFLLQIMYQTPEIRLLPRLAPIRPQINSLKNDTPLCAPKIQSDTILNR